MLMFAVPGPRKASLQVVLDSRRMPADMRLCLLRSRFSRQLYATPELRFNYTDKLHGRISTVALYIAFDGL